MQDVCRLGTINTEGHQTITVCTGKDRQGGKRSQGQHLRQVSKAFWLALVSSKDF